MLKWLKVVMKEIFVSDVEHAAACCTLVQLA
jgi:hypothetical protein